MFSETQTSDRRAATELSATELDTIVAGIGVAPPRHANLAAIGNRRDARQVSGGGDSTHATQLIDLALSS